MLTNTYSRVIEWGDCDPAGIVFNPQFMRFLDHGTTLLYSAAGWPKERMLNHFGSEGCPIVASESSFRAPCSFGDTIDITSEILEVKRSSFVIGHKIELDGHLCMTSKDTRVWTVRNPETRKLESAAIPDELRESFCA